MPRQRYWEVSGIVLSYTNSFYMLFTVWPETCERSERCTMHTVWVRAQERMMDVLEKVTFADLVLAEAVVGSPSAELA